MIIIPGALNITTYFMMRLAADGTAATGLTPADFDLTYTRSGATAVKADATLNGNGVGGAHSDSTVIEVDATNTPGLYRVDWVDAAFAVGVDEVICTVKVATAFTEPLRVELNAELATLASLAAETRSANVLDQLKTIIAVIESQRDAHTHQPSTGSILFIDPTNGDTTGNDATGGISDPISTIQDAHDVYGTNFGHDLYILVAGASEATSIYSEDVTISDGYALVRGPGRDLTQKPTANNTVAFTITGDGCELSGFQIDDFNGTGAQHGVQITDADFARIHNVWFNQTRGDGVNILRGTNCIVCYCNFDGTGVAANGQGVHVVGTAGSSDGVTICNNHFADTGGDSILIENGNTFDSSIHHNEIHNSVAWGINIGASSTDALVHSNVLGNNASGDIQDGGTTSTILNNEQGLKAVQETTITGLASQTMFNLSNGSSDDDAYHGLVIVIEDKASSVQKAHSLIKTYVGATKTVTLAIDPGVFTMADGDRVTILPTATASSIWDDIISSSEHNIPQSAGRRLRQATALVTANDTAEVDNSPAINQIQLADGESDVDGYFDPSLVGLIGGTGAGQCRLILEYEGATRIATLNRDWKVAPDATTEYIALCTDGGLHVNEGLAQDGGASTITLNTLASDADDVYNGQFVFLTSGPGQDQVGRVTAYNGTTKVATVETATNGWVAGQLPTSGTGYIMIPMLDVVPTMLGTPVALDGGAETFAGMLTKMADDNGGADFDAGTDSLQEIRDRGDAAWVTEFKTWYVATAANGGSDSNGGRSPDDPLLTLKYAADTAAGEGDLIHVGAGTFDEGVNQAEFKSGQTLQGSGMLSTLITGSSVLNGTLFPNSKSGITINDLKSTGSHATQGKGLRLNLSSGITINRCHFDGSLDGAKFDSVETVVCNDCIFESDFDGVAVDGGGIVFNNCQMATTAIGSTLENDPNSAFKIRTVPSTTDSTSSVVLNDCSFRVDRTEAESVRAVGITADAHSRLMVINPNIRVEAAAGNTGAIYGVLAEDSARISIQGGSIESIDADGGTVLDLITEDNGTILIDPATTLYDAGKTTGTITTPHDTKLSGLITTVGAAGAGLSDLGGMSTGMKAQIESEANDALVAIHLDHLLAVEYDPASKPGVPTALWNELIESDSGVSRYTVNALENAPSGSGSSPAVIAAEVWNTLRANHVIAGSFGESNQTVSSIDVSVSFSFGETGYCTRSDINDIFGTNNVTTWSDLNNDSDGDVITARVARSIAWATTEINDRLRGGIYDIPLPTSASATIVDICATFAGIWLYRSRGVDDESEVDKYKWHWDRCETALSEIRAGKRQLDANRSTQTGGGAPFAV